MIEIVEHCLRDVSFVLTNMRPEDAREVWALEREENPAKLAWKWIYLADHGFVVRDRQEGSVRPIAAWGALEIWPGVYEVYMVATKDWRRVALSVTRHIRKVLVPTLIRNGAHRAQCHSIQGYDRAHAWLKSLGATIENEDSAAGGAIEKFGKGGETFYRFVWLMPPEYAGDVQWPAA